MSLTTFPFEDDCTCSICDECINFYYQCEDYSPKYSLNNGNDIENLGLKYICKKCYDKKYDIISLSKNKYYNLKTNTISNIDPLFNFPFIKTTIKKCEYCDTNKIAFFNQCDDTYDLCCTCYNKLDESYRKYFSKHYASYPPKLKYIFDDNIVEL